MIAVYSWVHEHYRVVDLAWDHVSTWILAAVLVDLGYYWFHRASHEIALLWSVHQVGTKKTFESIIAKHYFYSRFIIAVKNSTLQLHSGNQYSRVNILFLQLLKLELEY